MFCKSLRSFAFIRLNREVVRQRWRLEGSEAFGMTMVLSVLRSLPAMVRPHGLHCIGQRALELDYRSLC